MTNPENAYDHYKADLSEYGLRIEDDMSEVEFFVEPAAWPTLRKKIDAAYEEWQSKQDTEEAFDNVQQSLDEAKKSCSHTKFGDSHCAEMSCHNYYGKYNNWTPGNYQV